MSQSAIPCPTCKKNLRKHSIKELLDCGQQILRYDDPPMYPLIKREFEDNDS